MLRVRIEMLPHGDESKAREIDCIHIPIDEAEGTVYLISDGKYYKIGFTKGDAVSRLKSLQTGCARHLSLIASMPGTIETEKALHRKFHHKRVRGEWFALDNTDILSVWATTDDGEVGQGKVHSAGIPNGRLPLKQQWAQWFSRHKYRWNSQGNSWCDFLVEGVPVRVEPRSFKKLIESTAGIPLDYGCVVVLGAPGEWPLLFHASSLGVSAIPFGFRGAVANPYFSIASEMDDVYFDSDYGVCNQCSGDLITFCVEDDEYELLYARAWVCEHCNVMGLFNGYSWRSSKGQIGLDITRLHAHLMGGGESGS